MDGDEVRKGREEEEDAGRAGLLCQRSRKKVLLLREKMRKARELLEVDGVKKLASITYARQAVGEKDYKVHSLDIFEVQATGG